MNAFLGAKEESVRILMVDIYASVLRYNIKLSIANKKLSRVRRKLMECVRNQLQECHTELLFRTNKKQSISTSQPNALAIAAPLMLDAMLRLLQVKGIQLVMSCCIQYVQ